MKKGMSLPVETIVIIVMAMIVLVAMLLFFTGTVTPGMDRIKLEGQKADLCSKYVSQDRDCKNDAPTEIKADLEKVCKALSLPTSASACCASLCPTKLKCTEQTATGYRFYCALAETCSRPPAGTFVDGTCDDPSQKCCKQPV